MRRKQVDTDEIYEKMTQLMLERQLYLQQDLTRDGLAREVLTNRTYITRALRGRGLNFPQFVNSFRAAHAIELMASGRYLDASPEEIALLSGFSSADTMNRYVKKSAGLTACALRERMKEG
jgi:AraC-like DNA-binding protein